MKNNERGRKLIDLCIMSDFYIVNGRNWETYQGKRLALDGMGVVKLTSSCAHPQFSGRYNTLKLAN